MQIILTAGNLELVEASREEPWLPSGPLPSRYPWSAFSTEQSRENSQVTRNYDYPVYTHIKRIELYVVEGGKQNNYDKVLHFPI